MRDSAFTPHVRIVRLLAGWSLLLIGGSGVVGCAYVATVVKQSHYRAQVKRTPSPAIYKHLLDRQSYFVFGELHVQGGSGPLAVVAMTRGDEPGEVVDVCHGVRAGSFYGLNLPSGSYELLVVRDKDADHTYTSSDVIARRELHVLGTTESEKVVSHIDIADDRTPASPSLPHFVVRVPPSVRTPDSVFFPGGTLRTLEDPLFSPQMATLGLYEPAAFMELAPMMFYALEEDLAHKVPVVFVHGIGGSPRDFQTLVQQVDRSRYRAWFFYYPSGAALDQVSQLFYEIFLSGKTVPRQENPLVIVAHSMGGLVVREALNRYRGLPHEQRVGRLITVASPLGGHPSARRTARAPVVIPSWRNLDPDSRFIRELHRTPLAIGLEYELYYTFGDTRVLRTGPASDGVVPVESQRSSAARVEATREHGLEAGHVEVLHRPDTVMAIVTAIHRTRTVFPEDHLRVIDQGGYDLPLTSLFTPVETYIIRNLGRYLDALVAGELTPFHPDLQTLVDACHGKVRADLPAVSAWHKLNRHFPDRGGGSQSRGRD